MACGAGGGGQLGPRALAWLRPPCTDPDQVNAALAPICARFGGLTFVGLHAAAAWTGRHRRACWRRPELRASFELQFFAHQTFAQARWPSSRQGFGGPLLFNVRKQRRSTLAPNFAVPTASPKRPCLVLMRQYALGGRSGGHPWQRDQRRCGFAPASFDDAMIQARAGPGVSTATYWPAPAGPGGGRQQTWRGLRCLAALARTTGAVLTVDAGQRGGDGALKLLPKGPAQPKAPAAKGRGAIQSDTRARAEAGPGLKARQPSTTSGANHRDHAAGEQGLAAATVLIEKAVNSLAAVVGVACAAAAAHSPPRPVAWPNSRMPRSNKSGGRDPRRQQAAARQVPEQSGRASRLSGSQFRQQQGPASRQAVAAVISRIRRDRGRSGSWNGVETQRVWPLVSQDAKPHQLATTQAPAGTPGGHPDHQGKDAPLACRLPIGRPCSSTAARTNRRTRPGPEFTAQIGPLFARRPAPPPFPFLQWGIRWGSPQAAAFFFNHQLQRNLGRGQGRRKGEASDAPGQHQRSQAPTTVEEQEAQGWPIAGRGAAPRFQPPNARRLGPMGAAEPWPLRRPPRSTKQPSGSSASRGCSNQHTSRPPTRYWPKHGQRTAHLARRKRSPQPPSPGQRFCSAAGLANTRVSKGRRQLAPRARSPQGEARGSGPLGRHDQAQRTTASRASGRPSASMPSWLPIRRPMIKQDHRSTVLISNQPIRWLAPARLQGNRGALFFFFPPTQGRSGGERTPPWPPEPPPAPAAAEAHWPSLAESDAPPHRHAVVAQCQGPSSRSERVESHGCPEDPGKRITGQVKSHRHAAGVSAAHRAPSRLRPRPNQPHRR